MSERLLRLAEAAAKLDVTYERAAELARQGVLPVVRLGRQIRVSPEQLEAFIASGGKAWQGGWRRRSGDGRRSID